MDDEPLFLRKGRATARKRPRRWGKPVVLTLFAIVAIGGAARFLAGPLFSVRRFEISGNERSRTEEILGALEAWRGRNLVTLDLGPLQAVPRRAVDPGRRAPAGRAPEGREGRQARLARREGSRNCPVRHEIGAGRVRARLRRREESSRDRRPDRRPPRKTSGVFLVAFGNRGLARRRFRYDGFHLPETDSGSSSRCRGEDRRTPRRTRAHRSTGLGGPGHRPAFCRSNRARRRLRSGEFALMAGSEAFRIPDSRLLIRSFTSSGPVG